MKSRESKVEEIDHIVNMVKFLDKKEFEDVEKLKSYAEHSTERIK